MSRWGPRPAPPCSWARCMSSLAHILHFFLEAAEANLTGGGSDNAAAGTVAPLGVAESHSCCCWSHSNSLSSSYSQWSARDSPDDLPEEQTETDNEIKCKQAGTCIQAIYQPPLPKVVPGRDELPEQEQEQVWQLPRMQQSI